MINAMQFTNQTPIYAQAPVVFNQAQAEGTKNGIRSISDAPKISIKDTAKAIIDSNMIQASDCTDWGWFPPGDPRSW